jgi:D-3-phosphoglycerate dehydrogenase / 2-oxoglutarate reductase
MFRILTLNNIAEAGLEIFNSNKYSLGNDIADPDAILLRSFNMHAYTIPKSLQVISRAGIGVNNIPIEAMTKLGIPVLNTPGANANAVKELVITSMLLACRNVLSAWEYTHKVSGSDIEINEQVEKDKKQFAGFELIEKTLGVIGLGQIGVKVANAAASLGMKVIGYDPAMTIENAWQLNPAITQAEQLEQVLQHSDFVTVHVPLNDKTQKLLNAERIQLMRSGAILLNFAREEIVDNQALVAALSSGKLHNYVCDFPNNLLKNNPRVICLPHLGASTSEAEENCAVMAAQQIKQYLELGQIKNSVNFPTVSMPKSDGFRLAVINENVPNMVAQISTVISQEKINIIDLLNKSRENVAYNLIDINQPITETLLQKITAIKGVVRARGIQ